MCIFDLCSTLLFVPYIYMYKFFIFRGKNTNAYSTIHYAQSLNADDGITWVGLDT